MGQIPRSTERISSYKKYNQAQPSNHYKLGVGKFFHIGLDVA